MATRVTTMQNPAARLLLKNLIKATKDNMETTVKRSADATIVSENNISIVLALIEQCVMEIYSRHQEAVTGKSGDFGVRVPLGPPRGNPLEVNPPEIEFD